MLSSTEKKLIYYTALFIAVIFNITKLMALRRDAFISQYWHFNGYELVLQAALNFVCCIAAAFLNFKIAFYRLNIYKTVTLLVITNLLVLIILSAGGITLQTKLFYEGTPLHIYDAAYTLRLAASQGLMGILVKIMLLSRESKEKDRENEQLRSAYLNAQLKLLKDELNPHFFFNTLSSLSAIVHEDPKKAQQYISHLSRVFRYTLSRQDKNLVAMKEELTVFDSYAALLKLRLEGGIQITTDIPVKYLTWQLPYMSLQPLLENITKHNAASTENPLIVKLYVENDMLTVQNNLQPAQFSIETTGIGLSNLDERFSILLHKHIEINKTTSFTVKLPLQQA
ncbi:MAG TPA: histidine kinase [Chitinophagaceae bacterium]|nr:histidine kinase [Chitinophagaceae bacterium]